MHNFHALLLLLIVPMMIHGMQLPPSPSPLKVSSSSPATDTLALFGIPKDLWKCGPGPGYVSDQIIQRMNEACPLAAADFNHCCAIHDDCYSNQRGRSQCDQDFCGCMSYHVKHNLNAANCSQQTLAACGLVERYGEQFYNAASQSPVDPAKRLPEEFPSITEEYEKLYKACEKQYATIASCALNFDICYRSPGNRHEKCVVDFQRCLDATHLGRDLDQQCDAAIEMVQWKMVEKVETGGNVTVLVLAEVQNNTITFVKKVYYRLVKQSSSFPWYVYTLVLFTGILCSIFCSVAMFARKEDKEEDVVNIHVTTSATSSKLGSSKSDSECSTKSSRKRSKKNEKK